MNRNLPYHFTPLHLIKNLTKMKVNHSQLTLAREYRGLTQTELSKAVTGLSQSNLSKFEKGLGGLSDELLEKIFETLNFPKEFFAKKINIDLEIANYRKKSSISKTLLQDFETSCKFIGYLIDEMADSVDYPDFSLVTLDLEEGYTPEKAAIFTRKNFRIAPDEPIHDIFKVIENKGIIIYELNTDEKFDGISFFTPKGFAVIVINKRFTNDRKRFTLAHELGHLVMHCSPDFPIPSGRNKEQEANDFASEFLMPKNAIIKSLGNLKVSALSALKNYWLTSKAAIVRRAYSLGVINKDRYQFLNIELSRSGEKKKEKDSVSIDYPQVFSTSVGLHLKELGYTENELAGAFSLPLDIIQKYLLQQPFAVIKPKLKVVTE